MNTLKTPVATVVAVVLVVAGAWTVHADDIASLTGTVLTAAGDPVTGAEVSLPELRLTTFTDHEGRFSFTGLQPGEFLISVASTRSGGVVARVTSNVVPPASRGRHRASPPCR